MHVCTNSIQKNGTALLKKREVNLEQEQGCPGAGGLVRRHEHVAHGLGRREALDDVVERGRGPRDDEERALGVAVDLGAPIGAGAEAAGEGVERDQRGGQRRAQDVGREEAAARSAAAEAVVGAAEEVAS